MGVTKSSIYTHSQNEIASIAKVIGHPARVAILQYLIRTEHCICGDLVDEIGLAQATISQHLKELKLIGIIQGSIEGTSICYCINKQKWDIFKSLFTDFFDAYPLNCADKNCC